MGVKCDDTSMMIAAKMNVLCDFDFRLIYTGLCKEQPPMAIAGKCWDNYSETLCLCNRVKVLVILLTLSIIIEGALRLIYYYLPTCTILSYLLHYFVTFYYDL